MKARIDTVKKVGETSRVIRLTPQSLGDSIRINDIKRFLNQETTFTVSAKPGWKGEVKILIKEAPEI